MARRSLQRSLGFGQLTASGVGIIIGAGIYVLLGTATAEAGASVWIAFLLAGALSAVTALSYAELSAMYPTAGAEYEYTRRVAPSWVAFVIGWLMVVALIVGAAAVTLGFAQYLQVFIDVPERLGALVLLAAVTSIAIAGISQSAKVTVALSLVQVAGLVAISIAGAGRVGDVDLVDGFSMAGVLSAAALVFFAFVGFDEVITLAEETRDPSRTVPRALLAALGISTLLYVTVAVVGVSVLGPVALGTSEQPLADVMTEVMGGAGGNIVAVIAMVATTNTSLLMLTAASRLQYGMATTEALPPVFAQLNQRQSPVAAIALAAGVAAIFVLIGDLTLAAGVTDFAVYVVFIAVNVAVILLRFRQPDRRRPFRIRGTIGRVPITPLIALTAVAVLLPQLDADALVAGSIATVFGIVVAVALRAFMPPVAPIRLVPEDPMSPRTKIEPAEAERVAEILRIDFASTEFDADQFRAGMEVELEHGTTDPDTNVTDDDLVATGKIALAHLNEFSDYYVRLAAMEAQAHRDHGD